MSSNTVKWILVSIILLVAFFQIKSRWNWSGWWNETKIQLAPAVITPADGWIQKWKLLEGQEVSVITNGRRFMTEIEDGMCHYKVIDLSGNTVDEGLEGEDSPLKVDPYQTKEMRYEVPRGEKKVLITIRYLDE